MKNKELTSILCMALLILPLVSSAGIASPYWESNPLEMNYGQTRVVDLNLQNLVGDEDITVRVEITEGSEIASLASNTYTAVAGTSDTLIPVTISIPENYDKSIQRVIISAQTVSDESDEGMVALGTGWTTSFDVIISQAQVQEESDSNSLWLIIIIIAIIVVIIFIFVLRRRE